MAKQWIFNEIDEEKRNWIGHQLDIPMLLATILVGRGIESPELADRFLNAQISHLNDPFQLPDIDVAVGRIRKAIIDHEKILVFGHDDTDGATSVTIMMETLKGLGALPEYYIPNRATEGYGFRKEALERFQQQGIGLIITVDSESSDFSGVNMANQMGLDVVISDHHEIQEGLPRALAVINPKRGDSRYPFRSLAGVGVAYQLARALSGDSAFDCQRYLELAALGSIADRVPLVEDNRIFSRLGDQRLKVSSRVGLVALRRLLGPGAGAQEMNGALKFGSNDDGHFSAVTLLLTDDPQEAGTIAHQLVNENYQKQQEIQDACGRVVSRVQGERLFDSPVIILVEREIPIRTLGACASTIRRHFGQPVVVIGFKDEHVVGEGRAPTGYDIFAALQYCRDLFVQYGGHRGAGGFSMDPRNINAFRQKINQYTQEISGWRFSPPYLRIDALLDPARVGGNDLAQLGRMTPFGQANPDPQFGCLKAMVDVFPQPREDGALGTINGVPFRLAETRGLRSTLLQTLSSTRLADVVYHLTQGQDGGVVVMVEDVKV